MDLDRFKIVNDSLGHAIGDQFLESVARRLQEALRDTDSLTLSRGHTLARLGGDEVTILLENISSTTDVITVADRIQAQVSQTCDCGGYEVAVSTSIGVLMSDAKYTSGQEMLRDADTAMYRAKADGKANYAIFDQAMHDQVKTRIQLEGDLRHVLEREQLQLYYQPLICLETGRLDGFEEILRWNHPEHGIISPEQFISIAEETGLILSIGQWVMHEACIQLYHWQQRFDQHLPLRMNINLSRKQLSQQASLIDMVSRAIEETSVEPQSIHLEITESTIMHDTAATTTVLEQIRALGMKLDMDDFGTGYSSLSCLHQFPLNGLKVDRSFVRNMLNRTEYTVVVHAIITFAHNRDIKVTAEGVENAEQAAQLQALECDFAQGYLFSRPLPADKMEEYINQNRKQVA